MLFLIYIYFEQILELQVNGANEFRQLYKELTTLLNVLIFIAYLKMTIKCQIFHPSENHTLLGPQLNNG